MAFESELVYGLVFGFLFGFGLAFELKGEKGAYV